MTHSSTYRSIDYWWDFAMFMSQLFRVNRELHLQ